MRWNDGIIPDRKTIVNTHIKEKGGERRRRKLWTEGASHPAPLHLAGRKSVDQQCVASGLTAVSLNPCLS